MQLRSLSLIIVASLGGFFFFGARVAQTQTSGSPVLAGTVSSQQEGLMEGVLVGAKKEGSTITVTVVSDDRGRYVFPQGRLQPGRYSLRVRAVAYDLEDPGPVQITQGKTTQLDLKLRKTQDLASQLSNAEWLMSMPGASKWKAELYLCASCHTLERIVRSRHSADEWIQVMARMSSYHVGSTPLNPQRIPNAAFGGTQARQQPVSAQTRAMAEYLATINLSQSPTWEYELKTLPRPKGRGTRAIITSYDLLRKETMAHDALHGPDGMVWYADFGSQFIGRLDPKTGQVVEYPVPVLKPGYPHGMLDARFDKDGNFWVGMMAQGGLGKFDPKTKTFQTYRPSREANGNVPQVTPYSSHVDGKVWTNGPGTVHRLDIRSGEMESINVRGIYGVIADAQNNFYGNVINSNIVTRIDAKTLEVKSYETPTPDSGPRRGNLDSQGFLWTALSRADKFARFDPKLERFQEWAVPTPFTEIYDVMPDNYGNVWSGGRTTDMVYRLDPRTGQVTTYLLPKFTNIRRVDVDSSTNPPVFWVGDDHSPTIHRLEPLD